MLLVLVGPVADLTEAMDEHGPRQAVAGLALVQLLPGRAAQLGILDPVEREQGALQAAQFAECRRHAVLPGVSGKLAHDHRCRHGARADGCDDAQDGFPMGADQGQVDAPADHRLQRRVIGRLAEAVEPAVLEIGNARGELEAEQGAERENMVGIAAAIGVVAADRHLALVIEQRVQHMQRFAGGGCNQLGEERLSRCT